MCQYCREHHPELWFYDPKRHPDQGTVVDRFLNNVVYPVMIESSLETLAKKRRRGVEGWNAVSASFLDLFARAVGGFQVVLPDEARKIVELANELILVECSCQRHLSPDPPEMKCISMNNAARATADTDRRYEEISKGEALELLSARREVFGDFHSIGWKAPVQVTWLCNCGEYCGGLDMYEQIPWGMIPSWAVAALYAEDDCEGCGDCVAACHTGAIQMGEHYPEIDGDRCLGCGLCVDTCPNGALGYAPRDRIFHPPSRRMIDLSTKDVIRV